MTATLENKYIDVDNVRVAYTVSGDGPDMVIMHGWLCNNTTVASIARTAARTHRVYNFDLPGFGASSEPATPWDIYEFARFMWRVFEKLGLKNPVLLGHSFGGRLAIIHGAEHHVRALVLVDAAGVKPKMTFKKAFKIYSFKTGKNVLNLLLGKRRAAPYVKKLRSLFGSCDYATVSPVMQGVMSKAVSTDLCHLMPDIKADTLLIWGVNDTATPISDAKKMEKLIPNSALVAFENCGHYSFLDNPSQFAAVLDSFLTSLTKN